MTRMFFSRFFSHDDGISAIEYALIAALIAIAIIVGARTLGSNLNTSLNGSAEKVGDVNASVDGG